MPLPQISLTAAGVGKTLLRLENQHRAIRDEVFEMFQQYFAIRATENFDPDTLGHAFDRKCRVGEDRCSIGLGVERQHERLLLIDILAPLPRHRVEHRRTAGVEVKFRARGECVPGQRVQVSAQTKSTSHTGRQIVGEVVGPSGGVDPPRGALLGAFDIERHRTAKGAPQWHHRLGELRGDLANILDRPARRNPYHARLLGLSIRDAGDKKERAKDEEQVSSEGTMFRLAET